MGVNTADDQGSQAFLGTYFSLKNRQLGLDVSGSPHEILATLAQLNVSPRVLGEIGSEVRGRRVTAGVDPKMFHGGPHTLAVMQILEAVVTGNYGEAAQIARKDPLALTGEHDAAPVPLQQSAVLGMVDAVRCLVDLGAPINRPDRLGMTPLQWAAAMGHTDVVDLLLERQACPSLQNWFLLTPAQLADANKHSRAANRLAALDPAPLRGWEPTAVLKRMVRM